MDTTAWIQLGVLAVAVASAAAAVVRSIGGKLDKRFDRIDYQFAKVDLRFDDNARQANDKFHEMTEQIERLKELGNDRHLANIERMSRLEGQIQALPQKIDNGTSKKS